MKCGRTLIAANDRNARLNRSMCPTCTGTFNARARVISWMPSEWIAQIGFSTISGFPADTTSSPTSRWVEVGVTTSTASDQEMSSVSPEAARTPKS